MGRASTISSSWTPAAGWPRLADRGGQGQKGRPCRHQARVYLAFSQHRDLQAGSLPHVCRLFGRGGGHRLRHQPERHGRRAAPRDAGRGLHCDLAHDPEIWYQAAALGWESKKTRWRLSLLREGALSLARTGLSVYDQPAPEKACAQLPDIIGPPAPDAAGYPYVAFGWLSEIA